MENKKCPKCESTDIINGNLSSAHGFTFIPENEKGIVKKSSFIACSACRSCGYVFGLYLTDKPCKLTNR